jgi:hypothetical protein
MRISAAAATLLQRTIFVPAIVSPEPLSFVEIIPGLDKRRELHYATITIA